MAVVMIGVDPHKASHTAVAINASDRPRPCRTRSWRRALPWRSRLQLPGHRGFHRTDAGQLAGGFRQCDQRRRIVGLAGAVNAVRSGARSCGCRRRWEP